LEDFKYCSNRARIFLLGMYNDVIILVLVPGSGGIGERGVCWMQQIGGAVAHHRLESHQKPRFISKV
jgi:hypothetical protein